MNDKQKEIITALIKIEYVMNDLIRDAQEEGIPLQIDMVNDRLHVSIPQRVMNYDQVSNDD